MIIGSHNSWSYLRPRRWWMRLIGFTARCQRVDVYDQFDKYDVRCFDLRIRFDGLGNVLLCHGIVEYECTYYDLVGMLEWLNDRRSGVVIRLLLDLRGVRKSEWDEQRRLFTSFYNGVLRCFKNLQFILGRELPTWHKLILPLMDGDVDERYSSVRSPKWIDDWFPWLYARLNNHKNLQEGTESDIMLIDFVDIV